jgi:hypothetical protein
VELFINTPYPISCCLVLLISSNLSEISSIMHVFHHKMVSISVLYIIISEKEDYLIGFVEFDMQLFRRKRLLLRIYSSARNQNQNKPTARAPPSDLFLMDLFAVCYFPENCPF